MNLYELNCLLSPEAGETSKTAQNLEKHITEEGGKIEKKTEPEKKELGYVIGGEKSAFLVSFIFRIEKTKLENLEKKIRKEDKIIRHMLVIKKEVSAKELARKERSRKRALKAESAPTKEPSETKKVQLGEIDQKIEEILSE